MTGIYYYKDNTGIYYYDNSCQEKWIKIFPATMSIGDTYSYSRHCADGNYTVKLTLLGKELVSTPAGNFDSLKFKREEINATNNMLLDIDYINLAKNVGIVKINSKVLLSANISGVVYGNVTYLNQ